MADSEDPRAGPWKLRAVGRFLTGPVEELYASGFFEVAPEEIRIRLRVRHGRVEMVVYAVHQGRLNELTLPFDAREVFAELCG